MLTSLRFTIETERLAQRSISLTFQSNRLVETALLRKTMVLNEDLTDSQRL